MLDKSIPYYRIILKRRSETKVPLALLPKGFSFVNFKKGDEDDWAAIETSVLEFTSVSEAKEYFVNKYMKYIDKLNKRSIFVQNKDGQKIATFTCWNEILNNKKVPFIHWVACHPNYQGMGIGKALISYGTKKMVELDGDVDMYIPTQTWSHKAISLYQWVGFSIMKNNKKYGKYKNQAIKGFKIINNLLYGEKNE